jgi:hypothetical protein
MWVFEACSLIRRRYKAWPTAGARWALAWPRIAVVESCRPSGTSSSLARRAGRCRLVRRGHDLGAGDHAGAAGLHVRLDRVDDVVTPDGVGRRFSRRRRSLARCREERTGGVAQPCTYRVPNVTATPNWSTCRLHRRPEERKR